MPEITKDLREIAESREFSPKDGEDAIFFLKEVIREYEDDQLSVDAEWLDEQSKMYKEYESVGLTSLQIQEWGFENDVSVMKYEEGTCLLAIHNGSFGTEIKENPTRGDVRKLLEILGGGE